MTIKGSLLPQRSDHTTSFGAPFNIAKSNAVRSKAMDVSAIPLLHRKESNQYASWLRIQKERHGELSLPQKRCGTERHEEGPIA